MSDYFGSLMSALQQLLCTAEQTKRISVCPAHLHYSKFQKDTGRYTSDSAHGLHVIYLCQRGTVFEEKYIIWYATREAFCLQFESGSTDWWNSIALVPSRAMWDVLTIPRFDSFFAIEHHNIYCWTHPCNTSYWFDLGNACAR